MAILTFVPPWPPMCTPGWPGPAEFMFTCGPPPVMTLPTGPPVGPGPPGIPPGPPVPPCTPLYFEALCLIKAAMSCGLDRRILRTCCCWSGELGERRVRNKSWRAAWGMFPPAAPTPGILVAPGTAPPGTPPAAPCCCCCAIFIKAAWP